MPHLLIVYASTDGQTRKIARHVLRHAIRTGHSAELLSAADADADALNGAARVVLCGSVHAGHYQSALVDFANRHGATLAGLSTLFLSVSLSAAGHDAEDWKGLDRIVDEFALAIGWTPGRTEHVAGAYLPSGYDVIRRFLMRRIIAARDPAADLDEDREYTDWAALDGLLTEWLASDDP